MAILIAIILAAIAITVIFTGIRHRGKNQSDGYYCTQVANAAEGLHEMLFGIFYCDLRSKTHPEVASGSRLILIGSLTGYHTRIGFGSALLPLSG